MIRAGRWACAIVERMETTGRASFGSGQPEDAWRVDLVAPRVIEQARLPAEVPGVVAWADQHARQGHGSCCCWRTNPRRPSMPLSSSDPRPGPVPLAWRGLRTTRRQWPWSGTAPRAADVPQSGRLDASHRRRAILAGHRAYPGAHRGWRHLPGQLHISADGLVRTRPVGLVPGLRPPGEGAVCGLHRYRCGRGDEPLARAVHRTSRGPPASPPDEGHHAAGALARRKTIGCRGRSSTARRRAPRT